MVKGVSLRGSNPLKLCGWRTRKTYGDGPLVYLSSFGAPLPGARDVFIIFTMAGRDKGNARLLGYFFLCIAPEPLNEKPHKAIWALLPRAPQPHAAAVRILGIRPIFRPQKIRTKWKGFQAPWLCRLVFHLRGGSQSGCTHGLPLPRGRG